MPSFLFNPADAVLFRRIWGLTWPMMVSNALELSVGTIEFLLVRPLGPAATAAIGVSRQVTFLLDAIVLAISASVITLVSQAVGARLAQASGGRQPVEDDAATRGHGGKSPNDSAPSMDEIVRQSFWLVLLLGVPTALVGYLLSGPILLGLQVSDETFEHGEPYLRWYFAGMLFSWGNAVAASLFRGAGNFLTPLRLALGMSLIHVLCSYAFIHGAGPVPSFGVQGAALGMIVARASGLAAFLGLLIVGTEEVRLRSPGVAAPGINWQVIGAMLRIGVPAALANVLRHGSRLVFLAIVGASALGAALHAAMGVGLQVRLIAILPALAFQTATATLVGQAIGRGERAEVMAIGRRSVQLLAVLMVLIAGVLIVAADWLAHLFIASPETAELGGQVLRWFAVAQVFSALSIGLQGALLGGGDTLPALRYTVLSEWCLMLPLACLCVMQDWVPSGLLAVWALAPLLTLALMQRRFRSGRWLGTPDDR